MVANLQKTPTGSNSLPAQAAYRHLKDSMGRFRTMSLFVENKHPRYPAPFTLKDWDHRGGLSMYQMYMDHGDPTEYTQAIAMLGSWRHWQVLTTTDWFEPYIVRWREELRVKFESDRYKEMSDVAEEHKGTPQGVAATKWLADRYSTPQKPKRGRPSKDEKKAALKEATNEEQLLQEEAERLGIKNV